MPLAAIGHLGQSSRRHGLEGRLVASPELERQRRLVDQHAEPGDRALDATTRHTAAAYGARGGNTVGNTTFVVQLPGPANNTAEWSKAFGLKPIEVSTVEIKE